MSVFAVVKLRYIDEYGREHWAVYEPNKHRIDCVNQEAANILCGELNLRIMEKLPVKIGGYKA